jgi:VWFA-related protein
MTKGHVASVVVWLAVTGSGATGAQQGSIPIETAERLLVDFAVTDRDTRPITDLAAAEVTLKIDGRTRMVRSLRAISTAPTGTRADPAPLVPPPYGSNVTGSAGRTFALVIDEDSFRVGREQPLRNAVEGLLPTLTPNDQVMLVTMPYGGIKVPFTTEHARLRGALAGIAGQRPADETGSQMACRTRRLLDSLAGFLDSLAGRDTPMTVLFFTAGLAAPRRDAPTALAPGMCELLVADFQRVGKAAGAARADFYVIQPDDVGLGSGARAESISGAGFIGSDNPLEGIEHLAGITGGSRLPLTGLGTSALDRVGRETSSYYLAEIDPERSDFNGSSKSLSVRVDRPGAVVRARPAIAFGRRTPEMRRARVTAADMLLVTDVFTQLPLRAAGFALEGSDGRIKVVSLAEPVDPSITLASAAVALVDERGLVVARWTAADAADVPLMGAMLVSPGAYRLRVAAVDTAGIPGTADYDLTAQLTPAGPLMLSSLVLGLSRDGAMTPRLQFSAEPAALASFEIYGGTSGMPVSAHLDVAQSLNGPAILSLPLVLERSGNQRFTAVGTVPVGALAAGDYVVRATIGVEGGPSGRIVRTLRKTSR